MLQSSLQSLFFNATNTIPNDPDKESIDQEITLCPSTINSCSKNARDVLVTKWITTRGDGFASTEKGRDSNSILSGTTSMQRQPLISEPLSDPEDIPREIVFYRRKRDWDLPRNVKIHWCRDTNVKHFYGIHKWMGQLCYTTGNTKAVIGTIVCYELQPLSSVRKSGHGATLLRSVDLSLYKLSLLAASTTLQSQTLWSDHWENLPLLLICNVYVPPPYRGLGLGLALVDDACRKPGRDIPWILTASQNPALQAYFGLLGFVPHIFGDSFGARWNDLTRGNLPRIADICPHLPCSSLVVAAPKSNKDSPQDVHDEFAEEEELQVFEETILADFRANTTTTQRPSHHRRRRVL